MNRVITFLNVKYDFKFSERTLLYFVLKKTNISYTIVKEKYIICYMVFENIFDDYPLHPTTSDYFTLKP